MAWLRGETAQTCELHAQTFGFLEVCPACPKRGATPGEEPDPLPPAPTGCLSSEDIERELISDARRVDGLITALRGVLRTRAGKPNEPANEPVPLDYHTANTIAKLFDVKVKFLRAAGERARYREDEATVRRRERADRELRGGAIH